MTNFDELFCSNLSKGFLVTFCLLLIVWVPPISDAYEYGTHSNKIAPILFILGL